MTYEYIMHLDNYISWNYMPHNLKYIKSIMKTVDFY